MKKPFPSVSAAARAHPVPAFTVLAYLLSWGVWAPLLLARQGWGGQAPQWLHLAGSLGPLSAGVVMTAVVGGRAGVADLLRRCLLPRPGMRRWAVLAVAAPAGLFALAALVCTVLGQPPLLAGTGASQEFPHLPLIVFWLANIVFYGFGEEVGWRGFALPHLQAGRPALRSSMIVAAIWAGWHLPLFWISAGLRDMPALGLIGWAVSIVTGSVVCTWLYNGSGGSLLVLALFHGVLDIFINSPVHAELLPTVMSAGIIAAALWIPRRYGPADLAARPRHTVTP
ncbi:CPBP family intramembrane glutamic endopeptidase [Planomonospora sp. ID82291]|uniref:CPBP family intramembrane glutamic endopeptidase n=1 Tax=Planomonospora sp. ID82291 TaxID=2738136 RepID=UPI0018C42F8D|nr:CPBP family intramembrane glutamic endopeptidase [Planomonospora sp. ID82291]MBG0818158.1 CPBP family intramembrane metalloprotease [Planomonospora sp. ID82291]